MRKETGWLIELKPSVVSTPTWYGDDGSGVLGWTTDNHKAIRFARKEDAALVIRIEGWSETFASEHMWCNCKTCGNTGFLKGGTGYGDVCPDCGGQSRR